MHLTSSKDIQDLVPKSLFFLINIQIPKCRHSKEGNIHYLTILPKARSQASENHLTTREGKCIVKHTVVGSLSCTTAVPLFRLGH